MNQAWSAIISFIFTLLLLCGTGCAPLSEPGVGGLSSGSVTVSTSPLQWQKARGPYFTYPDEARAYAGQLELDGHADWRLPTREEMLNFYYAFDLDSARASDLGINIEGYYWMTDEEGNIMPGTWSEEQIYERPRSSRPFAKGGFVRAVRR